MKSQIDETVRQREAVLASYKSMGLKQCAKFDFDNNIRNKQTGWGVVSADRCKKGISRRLRVLRNKSK